MKRSTAALSALAFTGALTLSGCGEFDPPCEQLPDPSQAEMQAAREGAEVEREVSGQAGGEAECVVVGDRWVDQSDEA